MKTLILLFALIAVSYGIASAIGVPSGRQDVSLALTTGDVKAFTRTLKNGQKQTWNLTGPNKGTWVDSKGKKVDSSNFTFKAPGTLVIKKVTKAEEGLYDYEPLTTFAPEKHSPGLQTDEPQQGIELSVVQLK